MKVVFLTPEDIPDNCQTGGMQCVFRDFQAVQKIFGANNVNRGFIGEKNTLRREKNIFSFPMIEGRISKLSNAIKGRRYISRSIENEVFHYIKKLEPNYIFCSGPYFGYLIKKIKDTMPCTRVILIEQNIEKYYYHMLTKQKRHMILLEKAVERMEKFSVKYSDKIICLNKRDSDLMLKTYGRAADFLSYITFKDVFDDSRVKYDIKKELLFVGSYFQPNYDGIKWFIKSVMPFLSDYKLIIVGKDFEKVRSELECSNVAVIGTVDDVSEYYYRYPALVMPILYGEGMKVKTAEALMYGKTIFASDESLVGYDVEGVQGVYRCNTPDEYASSIRKVFEKENNNIFENNTTAVRKLFLEKYENDKFEERFERFIEYGEY